MCYVWLISLGGLPALKRTGGEINEGGGWLDKGNGMEEGGKSAVGI